MPHRPPNGHKPFHIDRGFDETVLDPKKKRILMETSPGAWTIIATSEEPIEMLRLTVARDHALTMQQHNLMLWDEKGAVCEERFENYIPKEQDKDAPISPENEAIRNRFMGSILRWLLPTELWSAEDTPENQAAIQAALEEQNVEMSISPNGTEVAFYRDGALLTAWSV